MKTMLSLTAMDERLSKLISDDTEPGQPVASVQKVRKVRKLLGKMEWPFKITIDLGSAVKPKIAFWSGEERKYYPENPGHSKLAQVFVSSSLKGGSQYSVYYPKSLGVNKPISPLGYGIGGLLSTRFKNDLGNNETRPEPGTYNPIYSPCCDLEPDQREVSFGSGLVLPRFGRGPSLKPPGPGTYNIIGNSRGCKQLKYHSAFGSQRCIVPTTVTVCTYTKFEMCTVCGLEQKFDYYRTKTKVKHPDCKVPDKPETVILCRKCYCQAWNGHHPYWNIKNLMWLFQKSRHCSYVHEHRNLPLIIHKSRVKDIKKLTAKESVLAKYFSDHCQPELKQ